MADWKQMIIDLMAQGGQAAAGKAQAPINLQGGADPLTSIFNNTPDLQYGAYFPGAGGLVNVNARNATGTTADTYPRRYMDENQGQPPPQSDWMNAMIQNELMKQKMNTGER